MHSYTNFFEHRNSYAYAITNKRIIIAQQRILGQAIQSIDINNINDITLVKGGCLFLGRGKICVSSYKETFNVGVNLMFASNIHDSIHKALDEVLKNNQKDNLSNQGEVTEQIKKYKELLDMGAISLEEFNAKKDQLLHL